MNRGEVIVALHLVMDGVSGLPTHDVANVEGLIQVGELLVAFETLCTQLYEWEIDLTAAQVGALRRLGQELGAASAYTDPLSELISD